MKGKSSLAWLGEESAQVLGAGGVRVCLLLFKGREWNVLPTFPNRGSWQASSLSEDVGSADGNKKKQPRAPSQPGSTRCCSLGEEIDFLSPDKLCTSSRGSVHLIKRKQTYYRTC